ncbi:MAG: hypothetical protein U0168_15075 [Nannocystaceae bacterium]
MERTHTRWGLCLGLGLCAAACGDGGARGGASGEGDSGGVLTNPGSASASASESGGQDGTAASVDGSGDGSADGADGHVPKFDIAFPDYNATCGNGGGGKGGGAPDFSYIWVANSTQGTVSKINTESLIEEGRYVVRSDSAGSPSRTSVNLNGDMAVANRLSGVTKIYARAEDCAGGNTSTGGADVKPWPDDCVAWFVPFNYASQRPVAWTQGQFSESTCRYENTKLWTSGANASIDVILIDGETGTVEQTIPIPGVAPNFYGIYGAAVDNEGNFWGSQLSQGYLVRVDIDDFSVQTWPMNQPGYGMTVDGEGRPWTCASALARFDPATETWAANTTANASGGGCMVDANGILWVGGYDANFTGTNLIGIDVETLAVQQTIPIPQYAKGISIDFQGNVWAVSYAAEAYRVDPVTQQIDTFVGLVGPYTYSDMTGFALSAAGGPAG